MPSLLPPILDEALVPAVSALVQAADTYRSLLFLVVDGNPTLIERILEHEDLLAISDDVLNRWRSQLGLDDGEDEADDEGRSVQADQSV